MGLHGGAECHLLRLNNERVMTEFTEQVQHYCRNPKCRSKLPAPVANEREAFCTKGCHGSVCRRRCLVCERPLERKREDQKICKKTKCRRAWRAGSGFGCYAISSNAKLASKSADFIGSPEAPGADPRWQPIAGPSLSAIELCFATVGGKDVVEAANWTNRKHWREVAEKRVLIERSDPPVNILGGYKFPGAPAVDLRRPLVVVPFRLRHRNVATRPDANSQGRASGELLDLLAEQTISNLEPRT
jgi:hypothetical protein